MTMYIYTHTYILVYCTVAPQLFFSGPLSGASYKQNVRKRLYQHKWFVCPLFNYVVRKRAQLCRFSVELLVCLSRK